MQCPVQNGNPEILLDYSARKLNADATAVLERHLGACPECARFAAAQRQLWSALDEWEAQPVAEDFDARLYARIRAEKPSLWTRLIGDGFFTWRPAFPIAAGCATAVVAVMLMVPGQFGSKEVKAPGRDTTRIETLELEQVERTLDDIEMLKQLGGGTASPGLQQAL